MKNQVRNLGGTLYSEGIFLAKKGQQFETYTIEHKMLAVEMYLQGGASYQTVANICGIRNSSQFGMIPPRIDLDCVLTVLLKFGVIRLIYAGMSIIV